MDLDLALHIEEPPTITDESSEDEKAWDRSNKLSLMFMRMTVVNNLKSTLPKIDSAKEFKKFMEEWSQTANKSLAGTLMTTLTTMKLLDGQRRSWSNKGSTFEMLTSIVYGTISWLGSYGSPLIKSHK